ncbi:MAG: 1-acyl-sn-glycerol-3-phosphate acyltransferase [Aquificae bacterium]|nr:1-acyl-sn-glycerol-3-phosphate acyltransferase [Aquificota bacterium]
MEEYKYSEIGYKIWFKVRPLIRKILNVKAEGVENIPMDTGCIIAANHRSHLDPLVLNLVSPRPILFMAKEELFKVPLLSWLIKKAGAFPVSRGGRDIKALKTAINLIKKHKQCVGIFPEGGRMEPGKFGKPLSGVGLLVSKTNAPVVPARIEGTDIVFPVNAKIPKIRKSPITIKFGKAVNFDRNKDYQQIANEIMEIIRGL